MVGLLDLVEQEHRVRPAAHGLGQLSALVIADVAGRRAHQPRDGVLLHVLRHIDPHHRLLGVEQELGQCLGQLGLADACRAKEDERADRPIGVAEPGPRAADRVRDGGHGLVLADHPVVQPRLHLNELLHLALKQPADRDPGPAAHHLGHVGGTHLLLKER